VQQAHGIVATARTRLQKGYGIVLASLESSRGAVEAGRADAERPRVAGSGNMAAAAPAASSDWSAAVPSGTVGSAIASLVPPDLQEQFEEAAANPTVRAAGAVTIVVLMTLAMKALLAGEAAEEADADVDAMRCVWGAPPATASEAQV
jgi:hypothetical protein